MKFYISCLVVGLVLTVLSCAARQGSDPTEPLSPYVRAPSAQDISPPRDVSEIQIRPYRIEIKENVFELPQKQPVSSSTLPVVERMGSPFYVVYKDTYYEMHTGPDPRNDVKGYTTEVIRFPNPPSDSDNVTRSAWISQIRAEGELQAYRYLLQRERDFMRITYLKSENEPEEYKIYRVANSVIVKSDEVHYKLQINSDGEIEFWHLNSEEPELIYLWSGKHGGVFSSSNSVGMPSDGRFEGGIEKPTRFVERPRSEPEGGADTEVNFAYPPDGIWIRADGVEPINECLFVGLDEWLRGGELLERYAIANIVLRYHEGVEPVLAAAVLRAHRTGSPVSVSLDGRREGRP